MDSQAEMSLWAAWSLIGEVREELESLKKKSGTTSHALAATSVEDFAVSLALKARTSLAVGAKRSELRKTRIKRRRSHARFGRSNLLWWFMMIRARSVRARYSLLHIYPGAAFISPHRNSSSLGIGSVSHCM